MTTAFGAIDLFSGSSSISGSNSFTANKDPTQTLTTDPGTIATHSESVVSGATDIFSNMPELLLEILPFLLSLPLDLLAALFGGANSPIGSALLDLGKLLDGLCSMFTGEPVTGSTTNSFLGGSQNALDGMCGMFTGSPQTGTTGASVTSGVTSAIGTGSTLLTGDSGAITSGSGLVGGFQGVLDGLCGTFSGTPTSGTNATTLTSGLTSTIGTGSTLLTGDTSVTSGAGLMTGGINMLNALCGLCGGLALPEELSPRGREWVTDKIGQRLGTPTPLVNGASFVSGVQSTIASGSNLLTGDPNTYTTLNGLAGGGQGLLDGLCGTFTGTTQTGTNATTLTSGLTSVIGSGSTMLTGDTSITSASGLMDGTQNFMDILCGMFTGTLTTGTNGPSVLSGVGSNIGTGSTLLTGNSGSITSGSGLISGGIGLMNLLCGLCGGLLLPDDISPRGREWVEDKIASRSDSPGRMGAYPTPLVNGASLVSGLQSTIASGSNLITGNPNTYTTLNGLAGGGQGLLDGLCSMFTGAPATGTNATTLTSGLTSTIGAGSTLLTGDPNAITSGSDLMGGTQSFLDGLCGIFTGGPVTPGSTNGTTLTSGLTSNISTGSNVLTGDPNAITSGSGLIGGGITLLNLLCLLCGGGLRLQQDLSPRAREWLNDHPGAMGYPAPTVNGASLVAGAQSWIGTGSLHLTGDPNAITTGVGLADAGQGHLDTLAGFLGLGGTGNTGLAVANQGALYHADALAIAGNPIGLGTGNPVVVGTADTIPILAPVATVQHSFIDSLFGGLTGTTSTGHTPAQVGNAASQLVSTTYGIATQAQIGATYVDLMALNSNGYHAVDPSLSGVFNITTLSGSAPDTIPVTTAVSAIGFIHLPAASTKQSVVWIGSGITNLSAAYVNLYSVNTTTGALTWVWTSANILGAISPTTPDWIYVAVSPAVLVNQGDWYAAELQVTGTGTHTMVGMPNHWLTPNPNVNPQQLGGTRASATSNAAYDATGGGYSTTVAASTVAGSWSHTATAGAAVVVAVGVETGASNASLHTTRTATYGGTPMTSLGVIDAGNTTTGWVELFGLLNVAGGAKTVVIAVNSYSFDSFHEVAANSVSYTGVTSFGAAVTAFGTGTAASSGAVTSVAGDIVVQAFNAINSAVVTSSAYSGTSRSNQNVTGGVGGHIAVRLGDAPSAGSVTVTETLNTSSDWGSVAVDLNTTFTPVSAPGSIPSPTYSANIPWFALSSENVTTAATFPPVLTSYLTPGTYTFTIPFWASFVDLIGISGAGGGDAGGFFSTGPGGSAGQWAGIIIERGIDFHDVPDATITVVVGHGGVVGGSGTASTITWTDPSLTPHTLTAAGGAHGTQASAYGQAAPNFIFDGAPFFGGAANNTPGGGGDGGMLGGNGSAWIVARAGVGTARTIPLPTYGFGHGRLSGIWSRLEPAHGRGVLSATAKPKLPGVLPGRGRVAATAGRFGKLKGRGALKVWANNPAAPLPGHGVLSATAKATKFTLTAAPRGRGVLSATARAKFAVTPHTNGQGALKALTSPAFDNVGTGFVSAAASTMSWTHTPVTGNYVLVWISTSSFATISSCTFGGRNMTLLGSVDHDNIPALGSTYVYGLADSSRTSQTVNVTFSQGCSCRGNSASYASVKSVGAPTTGFNYSANPSLAMTCSAQQVMLCGFGTYSAPFTGYSGGSQVFAENTSGASLILLTFSAATTTFHATASADYWGAVGVVLA